LTHDGYIPVGPLRRVRDDVWRSQERQACPHCGSQFDAHGDHDNDGEPRRPENGDYTVCFRCAGLMRYVVGPLGFAVRAATVDELAEFDTEHPTMRSDVRAYWQQAHGGPPGPITGNTNE
jgi:hypothetical protein